MADREYRIVNAQVRSLDPLIVRYRCSPEVHLRVGLEDAGAYRDKGIVHLVVDAGSGVPEVPDNLPQAKDDFFPEFTELVFLGAVQAQVKGDELVVVSPGRIWVTAGAEILPVSEAALNTAGSLAWVAKLDEGNDPHQP
jgi:hypothetical protein